ncbi:hypothetical protein SAMN04487909_101417 [Aneurinibacillus migulanus]|uniref:Uncharacterized protein n=1 Tax=Aneurinibacillus migulanus TaxID=47500 RepID=A0A1G8HIS4_ANEMI|nr:hypothetical protein SAMN04487909_101417 [Aneurinibacillus migulanus]
MNVAFLLYDREETGLAYFKARPVSSWIICVKMVVVSETVPLPFVVAAYLRPDKC